MRINNNMMAMNTHRQLGTANDGSAKSIEKLSSGYRINRAGDDAAGLAISEKMRGQIRGLNQASSNAQDGISMVQTAEGALGETHDILQRMRELAVQSGNDTNVEADRTEIQKEMNQLTTEINRIGNTTEFNTQAVLKGDGKANLAATEMGKNENLEGGKITTEEATQTVTLAAKGVDTNKATFVLNGEEINITFATGTGSEGDISDVTGNSATIQLHATDADFKLSAGSIRDALNEVIDKNETLKGNYTVSGEDDKITVAATKTGDFAGKDGNIAAFAGDFTDATALANIGTTKAEKAELADAVDFSAADDASKALAFAGKGFTVGDQQIELYNADKGAYTGNAIGVNISGAADGEGIVQAIIDQAGPKVDSVVFSDTATPDGKLQVTAKEGGKAGNNISVKDGGVQENFKSNFQVGANQGQSMTIEIKDMRASALKLTGKAGDEGFTAGNSVTNGTNNNTIEAALDVSSHEAAAASITVINNAIESVSAQRSDLGSFQNRLEHTIKNLDTSSENLQSAESRIRDVDMAKEMMEQTKQNILSQAATAMLAQANSAPQGVLQLLR